MLLSAILGFSIRALLQPVLFPSISTSDSSADRSPAQYSTEQDSFTSDESVGDRADTTEAAETSELARQILGASSYSCSSSSQQSKQQPLGTGFVRDDSIESPSQILSAESAKQARSLSKSKLSLKQQSTPAPEELWSAAWSGFETPSALSTDSNRSGTQSLRDRLLGRGMSSTSPTRYTCFARQLRWTLWS